MRVSIDQKLYPLVNVNSLLWKITIEIVEFAIENGDFPWLCYYQRVSYGFPAQVKEKGLLYFRKPDVNHEEGPSLVVDISLIIPIKLWDPKCDYFLLGLLAPLNPIQSKSI